MRFYERVHGVYFDDLDPFQILHNARYLLLFERTIGEFWTSQGFSDALGPGTNPDQVHLVRTNNIEYLRPVHGITQVRVRIWVERLGRTSLTFGFRLLPLDEDVDCARGTRTLVKVDYATRRPSPWSDAFRTMMDPYRKDLEE